MKHARTGTFQKLRSGRKTGNLPAGRVTKDQEDHEPKWREVRGAPSTTISEIQTWVIHRGGPLRNTTHNTSMTIIKAGKVEPGYSLPSLGDLITVPHKMTCASTIRIQHKTPIEEVSLPTLHKPRTPEKEGIFQRLSQRQPQSFWEHAAHQGRRSTEFWGEMRTDVKTLSAIEKHAT